MNKEEVLMKNEAVNMRIQIRTKVKKSMIKY